MSIPDAAQQLTAHRQEMQLNGSQKPSRDYENVWNSLEESLKIKLYGNQIKWINIYQINCETLNSIQVLINNEYTSWMRCETQKFNKHEIVYLIYSHPMLFQIDEIDSCNIFQARRPNSR